MQASFLAGSGLAVMLGASALAGTAGLPDPGGAPLPRGNDTVDVLTREITPRPMPMVKLPAEATLPAGRDRAFGALGRTRDGRLIPGPAPDDLPGLTDPSVVPPSDDDMTASGLVRVADASVWPERAAGLLLAEFGPVLGYCSAALIGPATVLTAAHCIYDHTLGWADEITFVPGLNGQVTPPHGVWHFAAAHVVAGFVTEYDGDYGAVAQYDLAIVTLEVPVGRSLGWFGLAPGPEDGSTVRLRAYPGDRPFGTMWQADCRLDMSQSSRAMGWPGLVLHRCAAAPGASGGGMAAPSAVIGAVTVATSREGALAVPMGPAQSAWALELWQ